MAWAPQRLHAFIIAALRAATRKYPPKYETLHEACVGQKINETTGRLAKHYKCNVCKEEFPASNIQIDHIQPVIDPEQGFTTWDNYISRMFCQKENLQAICKQCHNIKTKKERDAGKTVNSNRKR